MSVHRFIAALFRASPLNFSARTLCGVLLRRKILPGFQQASDTPALNACAHNSYKRRSCSR